MITVVEGKKRKPYNSLTNEEKSEIYVKRYGIDCEAMTINELAYTYNVSVTTVYAVVNEIETLLKLNNLTNKSNIEISRNKKNLMQYDVELDYKETIEEYLDFMTFDSLSELDTKIFSYIEKENNHRVLFSARDILPPDYMVSILSSYNDVTVRNKTLREILNKSLNLNDNNNMNANI